MAHRILVRVTEKRDSIAQVLMDARAFVECSLRGVVFGDGTAVPQMLGRINNALASLAGLHKRDEELRKVCAAALGFDKTFRTLARAGSEGMNLTYAFAIDSLNPHMAELSTALEALDTDGFRAWLEG